MVFSAHFLSGFENHIKETEIKHYDYHKLSNDLYLTWSINMRKHRNISSKWLAMAGLTKGVLKVMERFLFHKNQENTTSRFQHGDQKLVCITGQNLFLILLQ